MQRVDFSTNFHHGSLIAGLSKPPPLVGPQDWRLMIEFNREVYTFLFLLIFLFLLLLSRPSIYMNLEFNEKDGQPAPLPSRWVLD